MRLLARLMIIGACCFALFGCGNDRTIRNLRQPEHIKAYSYSENKKAEEKGFAVCVAVDRQGIVFERKRYNAHEFKTRLAEKIQAAHLSDDELRRVPLLVSAVGTIGFDEVITLFAMGKELGLVVMGFAYVAIPEDRPSSTNGCVSRRQQDSHLLSKAAQAKRDDKKADNWCVVDFVSDEQMVIDGRTYELRGDRKVEVMREISDLFRQYAARFGANGFEMILRVRKGVGAEVVWRIANANLAAGNEFFFIQTGQDLQEDQHLMATVICPDGFFWGYDDVENSPD